MDYAGAPYSEVWTPQGNDPLTAWEGSRSLKRVFDAEVRGYVAELPQGGPPRPCLHGACRFPSPRFPGRPWVFACLAAVARPGRLTRRRGAVALVHPVLVLQVNVPAAAVLSFELRRARSGAPPACTTRAPPGGANALTRAHVAARADASPDARSVTDATGTRRRLAFSTAFAEAKATPLHAQVPLGGAPGLRRGAWVNVLLLVAQLVPAFFGGATLRSVDAITLGACVRRRRR
jgi:hypothetical protein